MTLQAEPLAAGAYQNLAETDRRLVEKIALKRFGFDSGGVVTLGAALSVSVAPFEAYVRGKSTTGQGSYFVSDSGSNVVAWPAANASNPRVDSLVLAVGDLQYGALGTGMGGTQGPKFIVVQGVAGASPTAPVDATIQTAVGAGGWERIADFLVPANAATSNLFTQTVQMPTLLPVQLVDSNAVGYTQRVVKPTDEQVVSSVALQNDDHLAFPVVAGRTYVFEFVLMTMAAPGDMKLALTAPTGTLNALVNGMDPAVGSGSIGSGEYGMITASGGSLSIGSAAAGVGGRVRGSFICTANGTLQLQWAQVASSAVPVFMKAGSFVEWTRAA